MADESGEPVEGDLPASERARIRHRDRKRETKMVVDNAGVRRVISAVTRRTTERTTGDAAKQRRRRD